MRYILHLDPPAKIRRKRPFFIEFFFCHFRFSALDQLLFTFLSLLLQPVTGIAKLHHAIVIDDLVTILIACCIEVVILQQTVFTIIFLVE